MPGQQQLQSDPPADPQAGDPPSDPKAGDPSAAKNLLEMGSDPPPDPKAGDPPPGGAAPYYPEGLTDDLKGKSDKETIDALYKRQAGLREQLSKKGGAAPDAPDGYKLDEVAKLFGDAADEKNPVNAPVFKILREAAHKNGLGQEGFAGLVGDVLKGMKEGGILEAATPDGQMQVSAEKELEQMAKQFGGRDAALKIVKDENQYLANLRSQGILSAEDHAELMVAFGTAAGIRAFQKLRAHFTGHELPQLEGSAESGLSEAQVRAKFADPRYQSDPAFRAEVERELAAAMAAAGKKTK